MTRSVTKQRDEHISNTSKTRPPSDSNDHEIACHLSPNRTIASAANFSHDRQMTRVRKVCKDEGFPSLALRPSVRSSVTSVGQSVRDSRVFDRTPLGTLFLCRRCRRRISAGPAEGCGSGAGHVVAVSLRVGPPVVGPTGSSSRLETEISDWAAAAPQRIEARNSLLETSIGRRTIRL